jgi:hypothetical protein
MNWKLKPVTFTDLDDCVANLSRLGRVDDRHSSQRFGQGPLVAHRDFQATIGRQKIKLGHYRPVCRLHGSNMHQDQMSLDG